MPDRSAELPAGPEAPATARRLIADWMGTDTDRTVVEDVKLLVSEVVTNAVRHPEQRGKIGMTLTVARGRIRVEVSDPGGGSFHKPSVHTPPVHSLGGRGLLIVDRVAAAWGVTSGSPTRVWFELPA